VKTLQVPLYFLATSVLLSLPTSSVALAQQKPKAPSAQTAQAKTSAVSAPELTPVTNPATAAQIGELLQLTGATRNANLMVGRMIDQMKQQAPSFFPQDFWADMQRSFQHLDAESLMVPYFQKYYSQPDVEKAIAFYKTPAGKHLVAVQPVIMQKTQNIVLARAQEVGHQVLLRHKAELEALAKQYEQQQRGAAGAPPQNANPGAPTQPKN